MGARKSDLKDLLSKNAIIDKGGRSFAVKQNIVIGTAAMIPFTKNKIELVKMTVHKSFRGKGVSKIL